MTAEHDHPPRKPGLGLPLVSSPTAIDPVCGMRVDPATAHGPHRHEGRDYYFCCPHCLNRFAADPRRYLEPRPNPAAAAVPPGTKYTCPMHPEVVSDRPGSCPKCGMALEPLEVAAE